MKPQETNANNSESPKAPNPAPESSGMAYGMGTMGGAPVDAHKAKKVPVVAIGVILLIIIAVIGTVLAST